MLRHVIGLLGTHTDAEDIVQETYSRLLRADDLELHEHRAKSYMYRIATNLAYDRHRSPVERSFDELARDDQPISQLGGPEAIAKLDQTIEGITRALLALQPRARRVFLMRTAEGMSFEAIAERLGIGKRTVERDMQHALNACQRSIKRYAE